MISICFQDWKWVNPMFMWRTSGSRDNSTCVILLSVWVYNTSPCIDSKGPVCSDTTFTCFQSTRGDALGCISVPLHTRRTSHTHNTRITAPYRPQQNTTPHHTSHHDHNMHRWKRLRLIQHSRCCPVSFVLPCVILTSGSAHCAYHLTCMKSVQRPKRVRSLSLSSKHSWRVQARQLLHRTGYGAPADQHSDSHHDFPSPDDAPSV